MDHLIFFACWVGFYTLHSLLAANKVKKALGLNPKIYRLVYSLFSTFSLGVILLYGASLTSPLFLYPNPISFGLGLLTATYGIFIIKRAFRNYSFREFMGFKKETVAELKTTGLQARMRHPLYTGTILLVVGYALFNPLIVNFISLLALSIYLPFGIRYEEKKLIRIFGDQYIEYKNSVPALFPKIFTKKRRLSNPED